jgi:hypothetical protein
MQRSPRSPRINALGWIIIAIVAVAIGLLLLPARIGHGVDRPEIRAKRDIQNYKAALWAYSNAFGELPLGDNSAVTSALLGGNPSNMVLLSMPSQSTNTLGEFIDPARQPYMILVTTNRVLIARRAR